MPPLLTEDDLLRSPQWFPLRIADGGSLFMVDLDEASYRAASFLDERLLALGRPHATCDISLVRAAAARLAPRCHYVFHTGHVGSTLISRLIGAHKSFFSVREPALLRSLCDRAPLSRCLDLRDLLSLLARTWRAEQRAVIKVTSIANELAAPILAGPDQPLAIFMFATPLDYLRGILAGPNSRVESRTLAPGRMHRLAQRLGGPPLAIRSEGEQIAMNWLCEMSTLHQAALLFESQVLWMNFDAFLHEPLPALQTIFRALGAAPTSEELQSLLAAPIMRQYSKAPEHPYDAALRREVLESADWEHGAEIKRGMDWLARGAVAQPLVQAVLATASRRQAGSLPPGLV